jgi:hypothetical protein
MFALAGGLFAGFTMLVCYWKIDSRGATAMVAVLSALSLLPCTDRCRTRLAAH